jgi:hypothetical protein
MEFILLSISRHSELNTAVRRGRRIRSSTTVLSRHRMPTLPSLAVLLGAMLVLPIPATAQQPSRCDVPRTESETPTSAAGEAFARANELTVSGNQVEALANYEESERLARESGENSLALLANASAIRSLIELGRTESATAMLDRTMKAIDGVEDPMIRARLRIHTGRSLVLLGERLRAADTFSAASRDARIASDARLDSYALGYRAELYEFVAWLGIGKEIGLEHRCRVRCGYFPRC